MSHLLATLVATNIVVTVQNFWNAYRIRQAAIEQGLR